MKLHERTIDKYLAKHGFCRFSVRPEHPKTDPAAQQAFKNFASLVVELMPELQRVSPLRYGSKMKPVLGNKEHLRANGRGAEPAPAHLVIRVTSGAISSVPLVLPVVPPQG